MDVVPSPNAQLQAVTLPSLSTLLSVNVHARPLQLGVKSAAGGELGGGEWIPHPFRSARWPPPRAPGSRSAGTTCSGPAAGPAGRRRDGERPGGVPEAEPLEALVHVEGVRGGAEADQAHLRDAVRVGARHRERRVVADNGRRGADGGPGALEEIGGENSSAFR